MVLFSSEEDIDRQHWVQKLYNATGQSYKPTAPKMDVAAASGGNDTLPRAQGRTMMPCSSAEVLLDKSSNLASCASLLHAR